MKKIYKTKKESTLQENQEFIEFKDRNDKSLSFNPSVEMLEPNILIFSEQVNEKSATDLIKALQEAQKYLDSKENVPKDEKKIYIYINTPGGSVLDGQRIMNFIQRSKYPVVGIGCSLVASMGIFILLSCHERYADKYSFYLIHQIRGGVVGTYNTIKDFIEFYEKNEDLMLKFLIEKTKLNYEDAKIMMERESQLSAEEAVSYGIVQGFQK